MRTNHLSRAKALQAEKRLFALQLRKDGHSYESIGRLLGGQYKGEAFTPVYASKLVKEAIKDIYREKAGDVVMLELARLDEMQLEVLEVLRTEHVMVSAGAVVRVNVRDDTDRLVMDEATGLPKSVPIRDDGPRLAAVDRLLKIQDRRARLLGLDKPTKVASTNPDGDKAAPTWIISATPEDVKL